MKAIEWIYVREDHSQVGYGQDGVGLGSDDWAPSTGFPKRMRWMAPAHGI